MSTFLQVQYIINDSDVTESWSKHVSQNMWGLIMRYLSLQASSELTLKQTKFFNSVWQKAHQTKIMTP